jgi:hypothetical protein
MCVFLITRLEIILRYVLLLGMAPRFELTPLQDLPVEILQHIYRVFVRLRSEMMRAQATVFQKVYRARLPRLALRQSRLDTAVFGVSETVRGQMFRKSLGALQGQFDYLGTPDEIRTIRANRRRLTRQHVRDAGY